MCEVPVFYTTTEGQTRRVAERIAADLQTHGFRSNAIEVGSANADRVAWDDVRGVILGASIHAGRHQRAMLAFAKAHRDRLNAHPSAFFSVSLAIASPHAEEVADAERRARAFAEEVGWRPAQVACVAGRLAYTKYGFLKRLLMRSIARREGGSTDTSRDQELTDWAMVDRFAGTMAGEFRNAA